MNIQLIKYILGAFIGIALVYFGYGIVNKILSKKAIVARVSQLPAFEFRNLEGKKINAKNLDKKSTWLIYFDSNCEFCQKEIEDIHQNMTQISQLQLLLISSESTANLQKINRKYGFDKHTNIFIVRDTAHLCTEALGMTMTPSSLLYNAEKKLLKKHIGIIKVNEVIKSLQSDINRSPQ